MFYDVSVENSAFITNKKKIPTLFKMYHYEFNALLKKRIAFF